jgi:hypothetical protein
MPMFGFSPRMALWVSAIAMRAVKTERPPRARGVDVGGFPKHHKNCQTSVVAFLANQEFHV